jgi:sulfite reductase (NADPH) flavoprotein alpha-component
MTTRDNPFISKVLDRRLLSSNRSTFHISLEGTPSLDYAPGDSIGVLPSNSKERVSKIIKLLQKEPSSKVFYREKEYPLEELFSHKCNIDDISLKLLHFFGCFEGKEFAKSHNLESILELFKPNSLDFIPFLLPLLPRMYSIASSKLLYPNELHLTVGAYAYEKQGGKYIGVGSNFLCYEATNVPLYIHKAPHFKLPEDRDTPIIMIGAGTGIAPYKAFIEERLKLGSKGSHWLFFGEQKAGDYYYKEFWDEVSQKMDLQTSCAFSREQEDKLYVQHKMLEKGKELWDWINKGSIIYICGDAEKMAKDVQDALIQIAAYEGSLGLEQANQFLRDLKKEGRLLLDVY